MWLVVYLNINEWGIRQAETEREPSQKSRSGTQNSLVGYSCYGRISCFSTAWRERGGKFICPPGNMSMSCRLQRGV